MSKKFISFILIMIMIITVVPIQSIEAATTYYVTCYLSTESGEAIIGSDVRMGESYNYKIYTYTSNDDAMTLPTPYLYGYDFKGWSLQGSSQITMNVTIPKGSTGNKTYIANWTAKSYTITFNSQGGSSVKSVSYRKGDTLYGLPQPIKAGYDFYGWFTQPSGGTMILSSSKMPGYNVTYYAHWKAKSCIIDLQYKLPDEIAAVYKQISCNTDSDTISIPVPQVDGCYFDSWDNGVKTALTIPKGSIESKTYTANMKYNRYTIKYLPSGGKGNMSPQTFSRKTNIKIQDNKFIKKGYKFVGWKIKGNELCCIDKYGGGTYYRNKVDSGDIINGICADSSSEYKYAPNNTTVELEAIWEEERYDVKFLNYSGEETYWMIFDVGTDVNKLSLHEYFEDGEELYRYGYKFIGWGPGSTIVSSNRTYKPLYKIDSFNIKFNPKGGKTKIKTISRNYFDKIGKLPKVKRKGYKFLYWYYIKNYKKIKVTSSTKAKTLKNKTVYANWTRKVKVKYNSNGGVCKKKNKTAWTGKKIGKLSSSTKKGYKFLGWYTKKKGGKKITPKTILKNNTKQIYAHWFGPAGYGKTITKYEFNKIENGYSYSDVKFIIGGSGELMSEYNGSFVYTWKGNGFTGSNAVISFEDGYVSGKAQVGLK